MSYKTRNIIGMLIYFLMLACALASYELAEHGRSVLSVICFVISIVCVPVLFRLGRK